MPASATLRDRLPSAATALAVQAAFIALLVLSFEVVRHAVPDKETILILPPLPRALPKRAPVVIDARPQASTATPSPVAIAPPPAWAMPGFALGGGREGIQMAPPPGLTECKPERYGDLNASERARCPPPGGLARRDPNAVPLTDRPVKNAPIWQSEIERRNTPPRVPCVSLTNSDVGMSGFRKEDHGARLDITCALKEWENPSLLPPVSGTPAADSGPQHASDDAFNQALQAVNARKQVLSGRPATAAANAGAAP